VEYWLFVTVRKALSDSHDQEHCQITPSLLQWYYNIPGINPYFWWQKSREQGYNHCEMRDKADILPLVI